MMKLEGMKNDQMTKSRVLFLCHSAFVLRHWLSAHWVEGSSAGRPTRLQLEPSPRAGVLEPLRAGAASIPD